MKTFISARKQCSSVLRNPIPETAERSGERTCGGEKSSGRRRGMNFHRTGNRVVTSSRNCAKMVGWLLRRVIDCRSGFPPGCAPPFGARPDAGEDYQVGGQPRRHIGVVLK